MLDVISLPLFVYFQHFGRDVILKVQAITVGILYGSLTAGGSACSVYLSLLSLTVNGHG